MIETFNPLQSDWEYVFYDLDLIITKILLKELIDYIIKKTHDEELLKLIHKNLIFKRLLYKLITISTIWFNQSFYEPIDIIQSVVFFSLSVALTDIEPKLK